MRQIDYVSRHSQGKNLSKKTLLEEKIVRGNNQTENIPD